MCLTKVDRTTTPDNKEQTMNLPTFKLHVTETNTAVIEVQASTLEEAKQEAHTLWEDGMVAFYDVEVDFEHIPTQDYCIGTKIFLPHNNKTLMLAQVAPGRLMLINTDTGNRWNDEHITNSVQAAHEEIEWMVNPPSSPRDRYEWYEI